MQHPYNLVLEETENDHAEQVAGYLGLTVPELILFLIEQKHHQLLEEIRVMGEAAQRRKAKHEAEGVSTEPAIMSQSKESYLGAFGISTPVMPRKR